MITPALFCTGTYCRQISLVCITGIAGVVAYFGALIAYGVFERQEGDFLGEINSTRVRLFVQLVCLLCVSRVCVPRKKVFGDLAVICVPLQYASIFCVGYAYVK